MLAPIFNSISTLLSRLSATRAGYLDNLNQFAGSYFTSSRGAKLDNLDAAITTRAAGADYTQARAVKLDNLDAAISTRMSGIKGIQRGTFTITGSNATGTATITSVNTAKTELRLLGVIREGDAAKNCIITLTNATTITGTRATPASPETMTVSWELTEYL